MYMAKKLIVLFGAVFLVVGVLGFIANPIVGDMGFFHADTMHNLVHLVSGLLFLIVGFSAPAKAGLTMKIFGAVYLLVAILGFLMVDASGTGSVLGLIEVNSADNWLHVVLGLVIFGAGSMAKSDIAMTQPMM